MNTVFESSLTLALSTVDDMISGFMLANLCMKREDKLSENIIIIIRS